MIAGERSAVVAAYELANPGMIDSGAVDALLDKYERNLGRLLQRVNSKYDLVAADGCLMYRGGGRGRWYETCVELHARGRLAVYPYVYLYLRFKAPLGFSDFFVIWMRGSWEERMESSPGMFNRRRKSLLKNY